MQEVHQVHKGWFDGFMNLAGSVGSRASARPVLFGAGMGVKTYEELVAWRLAYELKQRVYALTGAGPAWQDFKFRDQIRDSARSAPSNIAEGFGRYLPGEFMRFLRNANGSLQETANHLRDGVDQGYFQRAEADDLRFLAKRASIATTRLIAYLRTAQPPHEDRRNRR